MLNIGDKVKIIHSPYGREKTGTVANIVEIRHEMFGKRWTLYMLNTKFNQSFYEWELEKINDKEE